MTELRCNDVGFDRDAVVRAGSEEEVMRQAAEHGRKAHGPENPTEGQRSEIRSGIRTA
jgi:predicted small metal-binding protein